MIKYDFNNLLEPYEFQNLVRDIVQVRDHIILETFSEGKDNGIDFRTKDEKNSIIVQVKNYKNFQQLYQQLKKEEYQKIKKLNPTRYLLVTSVQLTTNQKEKLYNLLKEYVTSYSDIISGLDLNNLLQQPAYQDIELNYPNLWYNSSNTFFKKVEEIMHHEIYEETRAEYERVKDTLNHYVPLPDIINIKNKLEKNHYILITGSAGMGKTSLAHYLVSYYTIKKEYEFIYIRNISDANKVFQLEKNQIFLIDDFWGSNFKENDYSFTEERKLSQFIEKIKRMSNKKLILTSRDYVLKQGFQVNEELKDELQEQYIIDLKNQSIKLKTDIVISHLNQSDIPYDYVNEISYKMKQIVTHRNYNPRIIEMYLNSSFELEVNYYDYSKYLIEELNTPFSYLDKIYKKQSYEARLLLYILLTINERVSLKDLKDVYYNALDYMNKKSPMNRNLEDIINQLERNFIKSSYLSKYGMMIDFINPSIKDYLYEYKDVNFEEVSDIVIHSILYFNQVETILYQNNKYYQLPLSDRKEKILINFLLEKIDELKMIRGDFFDTIEFEKLNAEEQLIYKLRRLLSIDQLQEEVKQLVVKKSMIILEAIRKKDYRYIHYGGVLDIIPILEFLIKNHQLTKNEAIKTYYENVQNSLDLIYIEQLKKICKEEYDQFMKVNRNDYLIKTKNFIKRDLKTFSKEEKYQDLENLLLYLEIDEFNLASDDYELQDYLKKFQLPYEYYEEIDLLLEEEEEPIIEDEFLDTIIDYSRRKLYLEEDYYSIKDLLKEKYSKEDQKNILKRLSKTNYIAEYEKKSYLELVTDYYDNYHIFPKKQSTFSVTLLYLILEKNNLNKEDYMVYLLNIAFTSFWKNEKNFSKKLLLESDKAITEEVIKKILDSHLLVKTGKWYKFCSPLIQTFLIAQYLLYLEKEERTKIYENLYFMISPLSTHIFTFEEDTIVLYQNLMELDSELFTKYYIRPYLEEFIQSVDGRTKKSIIKTVIEFFKVTLDLSEWNHDTLENYGYSICNSELLLIYELITDIVYLPELLFTKESLEDITERFKFLFIENSNRIDFEQLIDNDSFYEWLKIYKLDETILTLYKNIKKLYEFTENNYYRTFQEYKNLLEE